jgi:thioredoxin
MTKLATIITALALYQQQAVAFQPVAAPLHRAVSWLEYSSSSSSHQDIGSMKIAALQAELQERGIQVSASSDRDELAQRVAEARDRKIYYVPPSASTESSVSASQEGEEDQDLTRLRAMSIRDLREECNTRQIRWGTLIEKEELVQAIWKDIQGILPTCSVSELSGEELDKFFDLETPMLLDVYAQYCGPCKLMAAQLEAAAAELGDKCKICKLDSEKYPDWASKFNVRALPTVLVIKKGEVINRLEGAFAKDKIIEAVGPYV